MSNGEEIGFLCLEVGGKDLGMGVDVYEFVSGILESEVVYICGFFDLGWSRR